MNSLAEGTLEHFADLLALRIQQVRREGFLDGEEALLGLDCATDAARAPFQFDMVEARLHRTGCAAIPRGSRSTLYAVWAMKHGDEKLACPSCLPTPHDNRAPENGDTSDLVLGVISIVEQFSSVLRQRGKEYRKSTSGQAAIQKMGGLFGSEILATHRPTPVVISL
jgi:hypothetical protein